MRGNQTSVRDFLRQQESPTFFEYGLLIIVIALVVVVAASILGTAVSQYFLDAASPK